MAHLPESKALPSSILPTNGESINHRSFLSASLRPADLDITKYVSVVILYTSDFWISQYIDAQIDESQNRAKTASPSG
jgi:hypothetical protein